MVSHLTTKCNREYLNKIRQIEFGIEQNHVRRNNWQLSTKICKDRRIFNKEILILWIPELITVFVRAPK